MEITSGMDTTELVIMALLGLVILLFGYRIKKIAFFIIWFLLGYNLLAFLMPTINDTWQVVRESQLYQELLPIGGGLVLALVGFSIEKLCLGGACFALVMLITVRYFGTEVQSLAIGGILGVVAAGASTALMKPATIIATAAAGGYALTLVALATVPGIDQGVMYWPTLIGLTAVGALFQFLTTKRVS